MTATVKLASSARKDARRAAAWYEDRRLGYGDRFIAELGLVIEHIAANPLQYETLTRHYRRAFLRRFPFVVVYLVDGPVVIVLGVLPMQADPSLVAHLLKR